MFGFNKKTTEEKFREYVAAKNKLGAEKLVLKLFSDPSSQEHELAWFAGAVHELNLDGAFGVLYDFVIRFPGSAHPVRALLADLHARTSRCDLTTPHSRLYLRTARELGLFETMGETKIIRDGISWAFLLLTSAYTELGARSYSKSILEMSLSHALSENWKSSIEAEIQTLDKELNTPENKALDLEWVSFFKSGRFADKLHKSCKQKVYEEMADIVDLIETNFRFNSNYTVTPETAFKIVITDKNNSRVLA